MFQMTARVEEELSHQASTYATDLESQLCQPIQAMLEVSH